MSACCFAENDVPCKRKKKQQDGDTRQRSRKIRWRPTQIRMPQRSGDERAHVRKMRSNAMVAQACNKCAQSAIDKFDRWQ